MFDERIKGETKIDLDVIKKPQENGVMDIKQRSCFRKMQNINIVKYFWEFKQDEN